MHACPGYDLNGVDEVNQESCLHVLILRYPEPLFSDKALLGFMLQSLVV